MRIRTRNLNNFPKSIISLNDKKRFGSSQKNPYGRGGSKFDFK